MYEAISLHMIQHGVFPEADGREPWFICAALSEEDVAETLQKFEEAVRAVKGQLN
jgi:glutamate-1-semialdehyde aminotransferase